MFLIRDRKIIAHLVKVGWKIIIDPPQYVEIVLFLLSIIVYTTSSSFDDEKPAWRNWFVKIESNSFENGRIIYDGETFLWLVSPRRQFAASPGSPSETKFG